MTSPDLPALLEIATRAAEAAGRALAERAGDVHAVESKTSATDPVSEADRASEELLVDLLLSARPMTGCSARRGQTDGGRPGCGG
jgi:myo-inositol-1(or 4)-monophosphatase